MPLLLPRIGVVVVAVQLPEAHPVGRHQLELAQELGRLPEVALGHEQPQRGAVVGLERLARVRVGQQHVVVAQELERDVGGVAAVGVGHHVGGVGHHACAVQHLAHRHAAPDGVELRPAGHAVDVRRDLALGQCHQLVPGQAQLAVHAAEDREVPAGEVELRVRPHRQHRKALGQVLAGRHPGRVDPQIAGLPPAALAEDPRGDGHAPILEPSTRQGSPVRGRYDAAPAAPGKE
jgi:hypothetical protein